MIVILHEFVCNLREQKILYKQYVIIGVVLKITKYLKGVLYLKKKPFLIYCERRSRPDEYFKFSIGNYKS